MLPTGCKNPDGAWDFMKFWIGLNDPNAAAETCAQGGWIPVSPAVVYNDKFQKYLTANPLLEPFVKLAASENQFPTPQLPGAPFFQRTIEQTAYQALFDISHNQSPRQRLQQANYRIQQHLDRQTATVKEIR